MQKSPLMSRITRSIVKNRGCNDFLRNFVTSLLFSLTREGFEIQLTRRKVPIKNRSVSPLYYLYYPMENPLCLYRIEGAPSLALNPATVFTFQRVIWRTMRASISSPFNICIPQRAIFITGILKHSSPIPKSKPQQEMQHYVILVK